MIKSKNTSYENVVFSIFLTGIFTISITLFVIVLYLISIM